MKVCVAWGEINANAGERVRDLQRVSSKAGEIPPWILSVDYGARGQRFGSLRFGIETSELLQ